MRPRRSFTAIAATAATLIATTAAAPPVPAWADGATTEYTVLAGEQVSPAAATAAIAAAGGTVVEHNDDVGLFRVLAPAAGFIERATAAPAQSGTAAPAQAGTAAPALVGVARRTPIGRSPGPKPAVVEREGTGPGSGSASAPDRRSGPAGPEPPTPAAADPLDPKLWDMRMIGADRAHGVNPGARGVTVGVLDTGLDATNPDLTPNFSWRLSRNFAKDIPDIDGPCEVDSCLDPIGTDDAGHGTHVAGTIAAAANGVGITGVAPNVTLVELKGGQDSGYFFLEPVVNALTYAGRAGIDVVNMSFYLDPWLFNCAANPADSAPAQAEQRTIIAALSRALTYAHGKGVTLVSALGNQHQDLGNPLPDSNSPNYPMGSAYPRNIDNRTCLNLPAEGPFVLGVSALGPSGTKSDFSNYGIERTAVSAPGGWYRDGYGTPTVNSVSNEILSSYPKQALQDDGSVDADGNVVPSAADSVFKQCTADGRCGYYTYLQGTSMAAPHAVGVAALIVSRFGRPDPAHRGTLRLDPDVVGSVLLGTAAKHPCPTPALQTYTNEGRPAEFNALCVGDPDLNGFYGHGIVDAYAAVTAPVHPGRAG